MNTFRTENNGDIDKQMAIAIAIDSVQYKFRYKDIENCYFEKMFKYMCILYTMYVCPLHLICNKQFFSTPSISITIWSFGKSIYELLFYKYIY